MSDSYKVWMVPKDIYDSIKLDVEKGSFLSLTTLADVATEAGKAPWPNGSKYKAVIRSDGVFGVFVEAPDGEYAVYGLIPSERGPQ